MAYEINNTSGSTLTNLEDNQRLTIGDGSNGITLFGKNADNYGEKLNENFLRLVENFAKATEPTTPVGQTPIVGQLWWDTANKVLKVRSDTATWKSVGAPLIANTQPSNPKDGELWYDSTQASRQLKIYYGGNWQIVGPQSIADQGSSGFVVDVIDGSPIVKISVASDDVAIFTNNTINLSVGVLPDFPRTLYPGINLRASSESGGFTTGAVRISTAGIVPTNNGVQNIGSSSYKFDKVYANTLYGDGSNVTNVAASSASTATTATNATNIAVATTSGTDTGAKYVTYVGGTSSNQSVGVDAELTYTPNSSGNSSIGLLKAPKIEASGVIESKVSTTGSTPPFIVASTDLVTNLHAATADKWHTTRKIQLSGAVTSGEVDIDGSGNVTINTTVGGISIGTTSITGNFVGIVSSGTGVTIGGTVGPGYTATIGIGQAVATNSNVQFNSIGIGTTPAGSAGDIRASGDITAFYSSDVALKENITVIDHALEKVNQIRGVMFDWTDSYIQERGGEDGYFVRKKDIGVIAQEVEQILPEVVARKESGTLGVRYERLVSLLIEAVKELDNKVKTLEKELKKNAL